MAQLKKNSILRDLRGALGKQIVFKQYADKTVVSKYPDMSGVQPSALQLLQRQRMREAIAYAQSVNRNPELRAAFEKQLKPGESVFHKAKKAYFERLKKK